MIGTFAVAMNFIFVT